jgi:hypothetical protein
MAKKLPQIIKDIRNNPPTAVNYAFQKNISYSQMSIYRGCQHRWKLQYKDKKRKFTSSIHTVFGSAMHEVIQHYLDVMYNKNGVIANKIDIEELFREKYIGEYQKQYKANNGNHFSNAEEMREFFEDGIGILNWFKKKKSGYFSKRGTYLIGCEIPITIPPNKMLNNVLYTGYLDVVMYHEPTDTFKIIDIKTSTKSWGDYKKKDKTIHAQLLLYKQFFSEQYHIPLDKIEVEFFILKRKLNQWSIDNGYPVSRIQVFKPLDSKISLKYSNGLVNDFIEECFDIRGKIREREYPTNPTKFGCTFCPYLNTEHCKDGISS